MQESLIPPEAARGFHRFALELHGLVQRWLSQPLCGASNTTQRSQRPTPPRPHFPTFMDWRQMAIRALG